MICKTPLILLGTLLFSLLMSACSHRVPQTNSPKILEDSTPILGAVTKSKILDRFKGYPICGMQSEEQKLVLKVQTYPLHSLAPKTISAHEQKQATQYLVEIECFFLGVQGIYEFALLTTHDGRLQPLMFEGAEPVKNSLNEPERRSPVALNDGRSEVCGVPEFDVETRSLKVTCKAPEGGCGAFAQYQLNLGETKDHSEDDSTHKTPISSSYFKLKNARFKSCSESMDANVENWSEL